MLIERKTRLREDQIKNLKKAKQKDGKDDAVWIRELIDRNIARRLNS